MQRISRKELTEKSHITRSVWERRHDDLLDWINDFFSIVEIKENNRYYYEVPDVLPDSIPKLPRKTNSAEKIADYEQYVIDNLPQEFEPNSYVRIAREAIFDFGSEKYSHYGAETVARRYVKPAMDEYGEHSAYKVWVNPNDYVMLTKEQEEYRHECFIQNHLTDKKLQEIGSDSLEGIQPSQEDKEYYQKAMERFIDKYGFRPILVYSWRAKRNDTFMTE